MGIASEVLGNHGAAHQIEYNGKCFRLSLIDQRVKSGFEKALFAQAKKSLAAMKDLLDESEYQKRLGYVIQSYEAGEYELFSARGQSFMRTLPGLRLMLSLVADCDENEIVPLVLAKKDELIPMMGLIFRESFPGLEIKETSPGKDDDAKKPLSLTEPLPEAVPNG